MVSTSISDPDAMIRVGASFFQQGRFDAAASLGRKVLRIRPAHLGALNLLGVSMNALGNHSKATELFSELTRRDSGNADHWMNLGTALKSTRRYEESLAAYARAGSLGEASADYFYNVGLVHLATGNFEAARTVLKDAVQFAPEDAEICFQFALCCHETMRPVDALDALHSWPRMRGLTTDLLARIALLFMKLGDLANAGLAAERALRDPSPDAQALLSIIQVQERTNQLSEARAALARLRKDPQSGSLGADLKAVEARLAERDGRFQDAHDLYTELLAGTVEFHQRHCFLFPLAAALDALARYDQAIAVLDDAHRSQLSYLKLSAPEAAGSNGPPFRIADRGSEAGDVADWDAAGAPPADESPIFIVGFPRSGTTLLEQTLDAHPTLVSMDETRFLHETIDRMIDGGIAYPGRLAPVAPATLEGIRGEYWAQVKRKVRLAPGQRLVDKNPLNMLALPAIRRLFPNSRILLAVRHPCDVILSCYMQHFLAPDFTLLCRDLPTLAAGYRRAFDFWHRETATLKPAVREVRYESLVTEFEPQVRSIADFLGLDWTDAMLAPGQHARGKGFISTPSYTQVVQPVHQRSVNRWKAYEKHFGQVIPQIRHFMERWAYPA